ncbi:MAG: hypothetical protein IPM60_02475 [Rhodospirillales bacterium]|nr:hypothetical protein [Rhodospirillales bacterium]
MTDGAQKGSLPYDQWIEDALRGVVRRALLHAGEVGLPDEHHFYVTFRTDVGGVDIPAYLRALHPEEMTIVLQHQFWDLDVDDECFAVTLKFRGKRERLVVPLAAISQFADPSVNFGLQLKQAVGKSGEAPGALPTPSAERETPKSSDPGETGKPAADAADDDDRVIALDRFRKK